MTPLSAKSSTDEIRTRFDHDVERFSQLESGQQATIDAPLVLDLVAAAAATHLTQDSHLLDLGCGAGNFTLRVLKEVSPLHCSLVDLSLPMLTRASERLHHAGISSLQTFHSDLRNLSFPDNSFDIILAGAVLHHLRDDHDWQSVFRNLHAWLKPGGRLYVADLTCFDSPAIQNLMWQRYGTYLESLGGPEYRQKVFDYIHKEDSPRSLAYQLSLAHSSGFRQSDVLHRNSVFACYYAEK